jgi:hypothetical protein
MPKLSLGARYASHSKPLKFIFPGVISRDRVDAVPVAVATAITGPHLGWQHIGNPRRRIVALNQQRRVLGTDMRYARSRGPRF